MESDDEQNESNKLILLERLSETTKFDYLDNKNDCLTDAFITIYNSSLWCIKLFFKSLWQVLLFIKEELHYSRYETINSIDVMSINNSAGEICSKKMYRELPRHHLSMIQTNGQRRYRHRLPKSNSQHSRQKISSKINMLLNKTRVTVRSISNHNLNRTQSNYASVTKEKHPSSTLGTINSHIIVVPVDSSHCQNRTSKNDLLTNHSDLKQSENINLREQLADAMCRRSYEPLSFINRGMCCGHCRPLFFPSVPFDHLNQYLPSSIPQQELSKERELPQESKQSPQMGDASETQSTPYSASPSIQSHLTDLPEDEPLSMGTLSNNESNEQNESILSFPEHDITPSQESEELIDDDHQLKLNAEILVDDLIQNAQKILKMDINQDLQNNKSKSVLISNKSNIEKLSDDNILCQELCNKLNLSDSNQIAEIVRILASNAPHILKEQPPNQMSSIQNSNINKGLSNNENSLCSQLLLHPPFKPKRLIHLCPDGSIQVLSAIDENSNDNRPINQQQYRLNYSNSAITPSIQQKHILTGTSLERYESTLALVDAETKFNQMILTESTSTQQTHSKNEFLFDHVMMDNKSILSLQQKKTLFKYNSPLTLANDVQLNSEYSKTISQDDDPIVKINLDLNDETIGGNSEDDENSLPEIFFKRIIAPKSSIAPSTDEKNEVLNVRRKNYQKLRHNRSRSYTNKRAIHIEG